MTFIDHTNEHHAHVITEVLAPGGFLVGVHRDRDGKIAMTLVLVKQQTHSNTACQFDVGSSNIIINKEVDTTKEGNI